MRESEGRDRESSYESRELVDTTKALIELYKSAFGDRWEHAFTETVVVGIGDQ